MKLVLSTTIAIMAAVILLLIMALYDAHQKMRKLREDLEVREIVFRKIEKQAMEQKSITENLTTTILKMIEEKRGSKINKGKDAKSKEIPN